MTAVFTISDSRSVSNENHSMQDASSDLDVDTILDEEIIIPSDLKKDLKGKGQNHYNEKLVLRISAMGFIIPLPFAYFHFTIWHKLLDIGMKF